MNSITVSQAQKLTAPAPFALLSTMTPEGQANFMAISWWTYLSNHPPMLGVCLSKKGLSGSLIEKNGEFGLSIVGEELRDAAKRCGTCSGKTTDKVSEFGIPLTAASTILTPVVANSRVVFECRLKDQVEAGDHIFYLAEIVAVQGDSDVRQLFAWDGYARLDPVN